MRCEIHDLSSIIQTDPARVDGAMFVWNNNAYIVRVGDERNLTVKKFDPLTRRFGQATRISPRQLERLNTPSQHLDSNVAFNVSSTRAADIRYLRDVLGDDSQLRIPYHASMIRRSRQSYVHFCTTNTVRGHFLINIPDEFDGSLSVGRQNNLTTESLASALLGIYPSAESFLGWAVVSALGDLSADAPIAIGPAAVVFLTNRNSTSSKFALHYRPKASMPFVSHPFSIDVGTNGLGAGRTLNNLIVSKASNNQREDSWELVKGVLGYTYPQLSFR